MAQRTIRTILDGTSSGLKVAVKEGRTELQRFKRSTQRENRAIAKSWGNMAQSIGRSLQKVSAAGALGFAAAAKTSADFERAMRNVNSIAKQSEAQFKKTTREVQRMGPALKLNQTPQQLAEALYDVNSAGFKAQAGLKVLRVAAKAASAGLTDAKTSGDGLTTALNAYGKSADSAAAYGDLLFKTVELGKTTFGDLAGNLGKVATVASNAGVSFEELNAGMAILTAKGLSTEEATVALRGVILKLLSPSKEGAELFDRLGISYGEAAIKSAGLAGILAEVNEKTGGSKEQISTLLGDVRAFNGALGLIGSDGGASFVDTIGKMNAASGSLDSALGQQAKGLSFQMGVLKSSLSSAAIVFGNAVAPAIGWVAEKVSQAATAFNNLSPQMQNTIATATAVGVAVAGIAGVMLTLAPGIAAVGSALSGLTLASVGTALSGVAAGFASVAPPIAAAAAATGALYVAWSKNLGGLRTVVQSWVRDTAEGMQDVKTWFSETSEEIVGVTRQAWGLVGPIVKEGARLVSDAVDLMAFQMTGVMRTAWEVIEGITETAWAAVSGNVDVALSTIRTIVETATALFAGDWGLALVKLEEGTRRTVGKLKDAFKNTLGEIAELFESMGQEIVNAWSRTGDRLKQAAKDRLRGFKNAFREAIGFAKEETNTLGPVATRNMQNAFDAVLEKTDVFGDVLRQKIHAALEPVRDMGNQVRASLSSVEDAFNASFIGRALGGAKNMFGGLKSGTVSSSSAPSRGSGGGGGDPSKVSGGFDRSAALARIAELDPGAAGYGVNFQGATDRMLASTVNLMEKVHKAGLQVFLTSANDSKHASGSDHYAGKAIDARIGKGGNPHAFGEAQEKALFANYAQGTGFASMLYHDDGGGRHAHLSTQPEADSRAIQLEGYLKVLQEKEDAQQQHLAKLAAEQAKHDEAVLEKAAASAMALAEQHESTPLPKLVDVDAEIEAIAQREEAAYQSRLRLFDMEIELGIATQEQKAAWLEQERAREDISYSQKLSREITYQQTRQKLEKQTATVSTGLHNLMQNSFGNFIGSVLTGQQTAGEAIKNFWKSVLQTIVQNLVKAILKAQILQKILSSIGSFFGGIFGGVGSIVSAAHSGMSHAGGAALMAMHTGGEVMSDRASAALRGPGGLGSDEVLRVLQVGETVIPRGEGRSFGAGTFAGGGASITINVNGATFANDQDAEAVAEKIGYRINQRFGNA
jgi:TP901 family phage tail tape measure protein